MIMGSLGIHFLIFLFLCFGVSVGRRKGDAQSALTGERSCAVE